MTTRPTFRFAPSPNGFLHLGHAVSAIANFMLAEKLNGRFFLRIEDIDIGRTRQEYIDATYEDLKWLGIEWEPTVRKQSKHFSDYREAIDKLLSQDLLYPCFATRKEISTAIKNNPSPVHALDPDGAPIYPGLHKEMSQAERKNRIENNQPYAYRIHMDRACAILNRKQISLPIKTLERNTTAYQTEASPGRWGDAVIRRKDTPTSYHLSVVVDDALQNITHVVRGKDLEASTDLHRLLQELLDLPSPTYFHHDLLLDKEGKKLSKSRNSKSLRELRSEGLTPEIIREKFIPPLPL